MLRRGRVLRLRAPAHLVLLLPHVVQDQLLLPLPRPQGTQGEQRHQRRRQGGGQEGRILAAAVLVLPAAAVPAQVRVLPTPPEDVPVAAPTARGGGARRGRRGRRRRDLRCDTPDGLGLQAELLRDCRVQQKRYARVVSDAPTAACFACGLCSC